MKTLKLKRGAIALAFASLSLTACGGGNSSSVSGAPGGVYAGQSGCVPISSQIGFSGTNIYFDWANIVGGNIPQSMQSIGQVTVGIGGAGGPYQRTGVDGTISMNIVQAGAASPTPYPGYPSGTFPQNPYYGQYGTQSKLANATGMIQISAQTQQDILYKVQLGQIPIGAGTGGYTAPFPNYGAPGMGWNPTPTFPSPGYPAPGYPQANASICVSGIAMNLGHYYNTIYGGNVFLYLNGTQHGYALYF